MQLKNLNDMSKATITLLTFLICANLGLAQEEKTGSDTTRFTIGNTEFIIVDKDTIQVEETEDNELPDDDDFGWDDRMDLAHWSGFDVGVNILMNNQFQSEFQEDHLILDPAKSFTYNFNIFEYFIKFGTPHVGLTTGLGFSHSRFGLKDSYMRYGANSDSTFAYADSSLLNGFKTNQLRVSHFNIPILFTINTSKNKKKNFHLSFGVIGGVRIGSKVRYKYEVIEGETEQFTRGKYNINPFHASLTTRIGFRKIGFFATYNMLSLFEGDKSRVAKPLSFGASIHF